MDFLDASGQLQVSSYSYYDMSLKYRATDQNREEKHIPKCKKNDNVHGV